MASNPSSPIEIPRHRQSRNSSSFTGHPTSPDPIFEMSLPAHYAFGFPASQDPMEPEPFMYHFPMLNGRLSSDGRSQLPSRSTVHSVIASSPLSSTLIPKKKHRHSPLSRMDDDDILGCSSPVTNIMSTTKITGFTPPMQPLPAQTPRSLNARPLLPSPRSSFHSSSWILPAKAEGLDEESASLEADPTAFEFAKHLIRRIENQLRFRAVSLTTSVRG